MAKKEAPEAGATTPEDGADKKKKKEKKESGPMSTPVLIGVIIGSQVMLAIIVIFALKFIMPSGGGVAGSDSTATKTLTPAEKEALEKEKEKAKEFAELSEGEELTVETGRIVANPAGSSSQFVVVNLGLKVKAKKGTDTKKLTETINSDLMTEIKDEVNKTLWRYSISDYQRGELKDSLTTIFRDQLKDIFMEQKILLQKVLFKEFLIQ